ncbi:MAG: hypothetical protein RDV48_26810 [Candidatus Eremiobacteraeota bacterium]|nr:hypothetical protein [Candidatus Eremiobacteraeota bacterium]
MTLKSTDRLKVHLARVRQARPLTVNINDSMRKIGYGVTTARAWRGQGPGAP